MQTFIYFEGDFTGDGRGRLHRLSRGKSLRRVAGRSSRDPKARQALRHNSKGKEKITPKFETSKQLKIIAYFVNPQVDNESFSAHRVILASQIPFFNAMFSQDYAEYSKKEIELKEIEATALESLINFAYSGSIRIDTANCQSIMIGASFLQLNKVRDACAQFLIQK